MHKIKVIIPQPFRKITGGNYEIDVACENVGQAINVIESNYPGIKEKIIDKNGKIRKHVNIYKNDENVRFLDNLNTKIEDDDEILILPNITGG